MISREFCDAVRANPSTSIAILRDLIKEKFGYHVPYRRVWEGKTKALARIFGDWDESYQLLPKWMYMLKHTNPGTIVEWKIRNYGQPGHDILHSVFWSFGPCIAASQKFCLVLQIDGTHLYEKYKGNLLIVTSVDSNGHLLPLVFAIIDEESRQTWGWFLKNLRKVVTHEEICLISDRHGGIISTVNNSDNGWTRPKSHHRFCLRHVSSNFNHKYKCTELKDSVYRAGAQFQIRKYNEVENIKLLNSSCMNFFRNIGIEKWTLSHDG
ncbi:uncharacterized protein LOC111021011 [Momordica charantia]|uniref:Uncharacterized protein LOC111021011 n=1 Tax=Momordica charantia TaxID=3673 RepID=A0A6J1DJ59_MOMCH|nr:uncharacterized protein LOC111021011 [Momordica charantia]